MNTSPNTSWQAPDPGTVRIGTAEREWAALVLGEHLAAGRLSTTEYEQRITAAYAALTKSCLRTLFDDLPEPRPSFLAPPRLGGAAAPISTWVERQRSDRFLG